MTAASDAARTVRATATSSPDLTRAFDALTKRVKQAGLMRPRPLFYVGWTALSDAVLVLSWVLFFLIGDSWWTLAVAAGLSFIYGQVGLLGHDTGHRQVFRSRRWSDFFGYLHGNVLIGVSNGWWVNHHNRHHSNPNHLGLDPDILRRQVIFATSQLPTRKGALNRFIIAHQSWMFFVLILLEGGRLHLAGYLAAAKGGIKRHRTLDVMLLSVHIVTYFAVVFTVLSPGRAIAFILVHQCIFGFYMGLLFAPNHKGMPVRGGDGEDLDWATRQIVTSRNLISNRVIDYLYGGLNYQIEHHLFPTMPSTNLRRARPMIQQFCTENSLPYLETGVLASYREVARYLGDISHEATRLG